MAGVMSLMQPQGQQGPMPGQAPQQPMPGMMPQQGAATPAAMVGPLTQMHMQQLVQLMLNPRPEGPPLYAVISAIAEKQKTDKAMQAAQGQQVMAQNQQMQQQPPVAAQVVQAAKQTEQQNANPEQQLRQRLERAVNSGNVAEASAIMDMLKEFEQSEFIGQKQTSDQNYANGGAVAFRNGGDPEEERLRQQIRDMFESASSPFNILGPRADQERQRAQDIMRMLPNLDKEQMRNILGQTQRMADPAAYQEFGPGERMEQMAPPVSVPPGRGMAAERVRPAVPNATTFDITNPSSINALRIAAQDTSLPEAERADLRRRIAMMEQQAPSRGMPSVAPFQAPAPSANLSPEMEAYFRNRASDLRTRQGLPEDILAGRAGLESLARENIAAQRSGAEAFGREAREQRDAALARAQRGIDTKDLLTLAGSIDTRRGQGIGSLARGAAGMLGQREALAEAARKEYAAAQQTERMLQANVRQATILEAQRAQALRENDFTRANQIKDQIDALMLQRETLLMERSDKAREQARLERGVEAQVFAATKPGETLSLLKELFPGQAPSVENLARLRSAYSPTAGERQDTTELKILQGNLQKQVDNILLPKAQREAAAVQLERVNAKLAEMAGLGAPATGASNDPLGIRK